MRSTSAAGTSVGRCPDSLSDDVPAAACPFGGISPFPPVRLEAAPLSDAFGSDPRAAGPPATRGLLKLASSVIYRPPGLGFTSSQNSHGGPSSQVIVGGRSSLCSQRNRQRPVSHIRRRVVV